jgi:hypothetical protein
MDLKKFELLFIAINAQFNFYVHFVNIFFMYQKLFVAKNTIEVQTIFFFIVSLPEQIFLNYRQLINIEKKS